MTISDRYFQRVVLAAVAAGFLLLLAAGAAAVYTVRQNQDHIAWVDHTYTVESALSRVGLLSERLETARRGYVIQPNPTSYSTYVATIAELPQAIDAATRLVADNPTQQSRVPELRRLASDHIASVTRSVELMRDTSPAMRSLADFGIDTSQPIIASLRRVLAAMTAEEDRLLAIRNAEQRASARRLFVVLAATGALMVAVMAGAIWVIRRYTADLNASQDRLRALNENLEGAVAARTVELTRANDELQRFAYIVSHDLRSPLVNVMGFTAELEATIAPLRVLIDDADAASPALVSSAARAAATEDLPEAVGFIRSSTEKMDRLINAILRLSREGRRTLTPVPIDLAALAAGVRDGVRFRLNELGAELDIVAPMPEIVTDRLALEQIMANLIDNAVKYLSPQRPGRIAIAARRDGARIVIDVTDNGRGIDPRDHERVFDLFRRSGSQDQPGEGLGLAHVRALAYRLGGVINCISELDRGATFRLSLPTVLSTERRDGGEPA